MEKSSRDKEENILTKHPQGKTGVNISKVKYEVIRSSIISCIRKKQLTYTALADCVDGKLKGKFEGEIRWYVEAAKLDLRPGKSSKGFKKTKQQLYRLLRK